MPDRPLSTCPTRELLEQFVAGELQDERVSGHLDDCRICSRTAEQIERDNKLVKEFVLSTDDSPGEVGLATAEPDIEGYEMVRELHRGGQGVVYEALQRSTKRKVAVKILLAGPYASKSARRRFEREIELVAQLKHPNIISIFESGRTKEGLPYFAMDYIRGSPLHDFVRVKKLSLEEALKLFSTVCDAVQYAHQRGVIHRDLKPSNIIVDAEGHPKVLDFGLAKLLAGPIETVVSVTHDVIGTLPYMSPEQAGGSHDEVDTRTDVYSLGVILYELLTGHYPYTVVGKMGDVLKHIAETPPTPPTRKWTSDCGVVKRTKRHLGAGTCPIDDDVEAMVLRALEKEPSRRYQTAIAFSEDIERYLTDKPILARAPSAAYQFRKLVARHKVPFAFLVAFFVLLTSAAIWTNALWAQAAAEAETAKQVVEILVAVYEASSDAPGDKVREILEKGAQEVGPQLADQPLVQASFMLTMGRVFKSHGLYGKAYTSLKRALEIRQKELGDDQLETLIALGHLATLLRLQGKLSEAEAAFRKTLEGFRRALGEDDPATLSALNGLGLVLKRRGQYAEAENIFRKAFEVAKRVLGAEHPATLDSMNNLGIALFAQYRYGEAEALRRETLELRRRVYGPEHPITLKSMNNLANALRAQRNFPEAEKLHRETLEIRRRRLGNENPATLVSMANLALVLRDQGNYAEAEKLLLQTLEAERRRVGEGHRDTLDTMLILEEVLRFQDKQEEARPLVIEMLAHRKRDAERLDADAIALIQYALLLLTCEPVDMRDPATALPIAKKAVEMTNRSNPPYLAALALAYHLTGDTAQAIRIEEQALALLSAEHPSVRREYEDYLEEFQQALGNQPALHTKPQPP